MPDTLPPLGRADVLGRLWLAFCGLLLLSFPFFPAAVSGNWQGVLFLVCWLALPAKGLFQRLFLGRAEKSKPQVDPRMRLYVVFIVTFGIAVVFWARSLDLSWPLALGIFCLIEGLSSFIVSLTEWWRLSTIGLSVALIVCGFSSPFLTDIRFLFGSAILAGSLVSVGILRWQIARYARGPNRAAGDN